tara:strand:- start:227 stop:508 length:282 start_codon:yes stop_codon:yes gene_type:complete
MKKSLIVFLVLFGLLLIGQDLYAQCAMCRGSVESSMGNGRNNVGVGLNTGIMFLFVTPYLLVGVIGYLWYRNSIKIRKEREAVHARINGVLGV